MAKCQGLTAYNFGDEDFVTLNGSIGATLGVSGGFIMDRMGNVYYSAGVGMVFGTSAGVSTGKFKADTSSWGPDQFIRAISGISGSGSFSIGPLSCTVTVGTQYGDREIGIGTSSGLSASGVFVDTEYICNIKNL